MSDLELVVALSLAVLVAPLVGGRWNVPVAAWLLPGLLLASGHGLGTAQAYFVTVGVLTIGGLISLYGQMPAPGAAFLVMVLVPTAVSALAFLADRIVMAAVDTASLWGFAATLVFPAAVVVLELGSASVGPFGSWGSLAYTQYGNLPLTQAAAVAGNSAITFVVSWFGSTLAWAWSHDFAPEVVAVGLAAYGAVLAGALLAGGIRLVRARRAGHTVQIASLTEPQPSQPGTLSTQEVFGRLMSDADLDAAEWAAVQRAARSVQDRLLDGSARQAHAGARILFWAEGAGLVTVEGEEGFVARGRSLAQECGCYLAMSLVVMHRAGPRHVENKVVMVTPAGEVAFVYHKQRLVPGPETAHTVPSDNPLRWVDTPYGRVGVLICFDADNPVLTRQVSAASIDILLLPASDWPAIDPLHSQMAVLRGIEHGVSVVRQARFGLSLATDPYGRELAALDHDPDQASPALVAHVPTKGAPTLPKWLLGRLAALRSRTPSTSEVSS